MASPDWIIYTRSEPYCVWCERTKILLKGQKIPFEEIDIATLPKFGYSTVPQVFVGDYHIGGYEKLKEYLEI
jgi:glutaredoxin 3